MPKTIQEVKNEYERRFLSLPGVVSVGIGQDPAGKPVIIVGLDKPRPKTEKKLPQKLDDFSVRVEIVGRIKAF